MTRKNARLTQDQVRQLALALPETHEGSHMGTADLRVRNKIFATLPAGGLTVNMKMSPENLDALVRSDPAAYQNVWGGRWVGVQLARVTADVLQELLVDAWRLTAPKAVVRAYDASGRPA